MKKAKTAFSVLLVTLVTLLPTLVRTETVLAQAQATKTFLIFPASGVFTPEELAAIAACAGEEVNFTEGVVQLVYHTTALPGGETKISIEGGAQGMTGTGVTSGATYRATGALSVRFEIPETPPLRFSYLDHLNVVGPGEAGKIMVFYQTHVTVNANGEVTAFFDDFRLRCQ